MLNSAPRPAPSCLRALIRVNRGENVPNVELLVGCALRAAFLLHAPHPGWV